MRTWRAYLEREPYSWSAKLGIVGEDQPTDGLGEVKPGLVIGFEFKSFHRGGCVGNFETPISGSEEEVNGVFANDVEYGMGRRTSTAQLPRLYERNGGGALSP